MTLRAISLLQPWASLVALGLKRYETRSWSIAHRGPLAIHASKGFAEPERAFHQELMAQGLLPRALPLGAIIAVVQVADCLSTTVAMVHGQIDVREEAFGDYGPDRFAWRLDDAQRLALPIGHGGALGIWAVRPREARAVLDQLRRPA